MNVLKHCAILLAASVFVFFFWLVLDTFDASWQGVRVSTPTQWVSVKPPLWWVGLWSLTLLAWLGIAWAFVTLARLLTTRFGAPVWPDTGSHPVIAPPEASGFDNSES